MSVRLIAITPKAEKTLAYIARVSSPNQENPDYAHLIKYLIQHSHWSPFEHAYMTLEIKTSRMISAQILRHRSFTFSEFSQRYAEPVEYAPVKARRQSEKNRQSSIDDLPDNINQWFESMQDEVWTQAEYLYKQAMDFGVSKECARAILPMNTATRLYMTGSVRSWLHYIQLRTQPDTQLEHRLIAEDCKTIFSEQLPTVAESLGWG